MFELLYLIVGVAFGALAVWVLSVKNLRDLLDREVVNSSALHSQNSVLSERINGLNEKFEAQMALEKRANSEKIELLEKNKEQMKLEFKEIANKILESNSQKFSSQNQESISKIIAPMKEQFNEFKKQIDDVYIKEAKDRSMLQAEIKSIKEINHQMSRDANSLTNALKGESKKQGVWGEMILESVLSHSGLREGVEFDREVSLEHESDGSRFRPDVIVHLPDGRDIIIDAKTSLSAYEKYASAEDEEQKEASLKEHIASMRRHIKELSQKDYANLKGVETLDFIFMFVPIESALLAALEYDNTLFDEAFKKNVILVGPTTLMVSLRAVENTWKYEHQQKNAQEIAKRAGLLFDKFSSFIDSVDRLGKQIVTVQKTYDEAFSRLHSGAGSITSQFQKLEQLGAATSKKLPNHVTKQLEE
ncbi:DNA recombination protein RmuC [Sulfurimonas sp.]|uniref:DNA recombination protein RmuC n=1 Tax=Sulfurimonas sp. TaxID=2022749 RepID=UPI0025F9073E|nr:DNA recombination protein RmuC [Sulfurimonas sp.]